MWKEFDTSNYTTEQIYAIIDDAITHGFEVKYTNSKWYYREPNPNKKGTTK